ncbi:MAG: hypothetical protein QM784_40545 [Polyangiaceae bacterium]
MTLQRVTLIVAATHMIGCAEAPGDAIKLAPSTLPLGLVAHYSFDEASGMSSWIIRAIVGMPRWLAARGWTMAALAQR